MKLIDTQDWYPAQLPPVKIIPGNAVLEASKLSRPVNISTLLDYLQVIQAKKRRDDKVAMQTAIDVLRANQRIHGRNQPDSAKARCYPRINYGYICINAA